MRHRTIFAALSLLPAPTVLLTNCVGEIAQTSIPDASPVPDSTTGQDASSGVDATRGSDATTGADARSDADAGAVDSGGNTDAGADTAADAARFCDLGVAKGDPLGGGVTPFDAEGNPLPAGRYRLTYTDGCMVYGGGQPYTVHAYQPSADAAAYASWLLVTADGGFQPVKLPGFWIYGPDAAAGPANYGACVTLNLTSPPVEFDYDAGAPLGVRVNDSPLGDNLAGPDGGVPAWRLEHFSPTGACP